MTKMVNIKNNKDFYDKLHELEDLDPDWFNHVGQESRLNTYIDDGDLNTAVKDVIKERNLLKEVRDKLQTDPQLWRSAAKKDAIRLLVTYYKRFDLSNKEISQILNIPESTIRHDYRPLKPGEKIHPKFEVELRDRFGKHLSPNEI